MIEIPFLDSRLNIENLFNIKGDFFIQNYNNKKRRPHPLKIRALAAYININFSFISLISF